MIKYRQALEGSDGTGVVDLCYKHGIRTPESGIIIVAIDTEKNDEVIGVAALQVRYQFEPLIAENPVVANKLVNMIEGAAMVSQARNILALVSGSKEEYILEFSKAGYEVTDTNFTILEKKME